MADYAVVNPATGETVKTYPTIDDDALKGAIDRVSSIELTGRPERIRSNFVNGLKRLPVRVAIP